MNLRWLKNDVLTSFRFAPPDSAAGRSRSIYFLCESHFDFALCDELYQTRSHSFEIMHAPVIYN